MKMAPAKRLLSMISLFALALPAVALASGSDPDDEFIDPSQTLREQIGKTPEAQALLKKYTDCEATAKDGECSDLLLAYVKYVDDQVIKTLFKDLK